MTYNLCFQLAPTFSYTSDLLNSNYVEMTVYKDDGTQDKKPVFHWYKYVISYFELIRTCQYDMERVHQRWNHWWQQGYLNQFNIDLQNRLKQVE